MLKLLKNRPPWTWAAVVAVLTFVCHLIFGVWFWTKSPTGAPKTSLSLSGTAYLETYPTWNTDQEADGAFYNRGALTALQTGVPRTRSGMFFEHAPLYAYFVTACYKLGGFRLLALAIPQALLSGITSLLLGLCAIRLAPQCAAVAGAVASSLILISLHFAGFTGYPSPTTLLLFLFALAFWAVVTSPSGRVKPVFYMALALGVYVQAAFFVVVFAAVVWGALLFWRQRSKAVLLGSALLLVAALAKPLIAFSVDRRVETHSKEGPTAVLWEANNPYYESMSIFSLWERRPGNTWSKWKLTADQEKRYNDYLARADGKETRAAILWIRENPGQYLKLCVVRLRAALGPITAQMSPLNKKICLVWWLLVFPSGALGLWRFRRSPLVWLAVCIIVFESGFESLILAGWQPRYRLPIDLMLVVFAGVVYAGWAARWVTRRGDGLLAADSKVAPVR